ncbi:hypothetical protein [Aliiroseovarius marinus]|uniref:hypothetical protein n=1 Tax=Aliiroseovarius marinus TaxID=2500159 RepID=UPI00105EDB03|nr:hypothetical protein [Aliiroseovarius marinus]
MKYLKLSFLIAALLAPTSLFAEDIIFPSEPRLKDLPKANHKGERLGMLALFATSVSRMASGEKIVMHGFITGSPDGTSSFFYWNDKLNMECHGTTERMEDKSGKGDLICTENGKTFISDTLVIPAKKYMRLKGVSTHKNVDTSGRTVWTVIKWQARSKFPDPQPLIDAFQS